MTLSGEALTPVRTGGDLIIEGIGSFATVVGPDLANGCRVEVHGVDTVLLPEPSAEAPSPSGDTIVSGGGRRGGRGTPAPRERERCRSLQVRR